jgi:hypothetical protein
MRADSVDRARLTDMLGWIADELQANVPNPGYFGEGRRPISTSACAAAASRGA